MTYLNYYTAICSHGNRRLLGKLRQCRSTARPTVESRIALLDSGCAILVPARRGVARGQETERRTLRLPSPRSAARLGWRHGRARLCTTAPYMQLARSLLRRRSAQEAAAALRLCRQEKDADSTSGHC
eukprot:4718861-Pleurochrysis_carterae.AAC.3